MKLKKYFGLFTCIGIFASVMFQASAATSFPERTDNSVIYIKNLTEQSITNMSDTQFIESDNESVISVVSKAVMDEAENTEKINMAYEMRRDLAQKKTIMIYGDKTNLSLEQLAELLEVENTPVIEYVDDIAKDNLNYLQAIYFKEKADGSHVAGHIYNFTDANPDEKVATAIEECVQMATTEEPIEQETTEISLQLLQTVSGSGNPVEIEDEFIWDEGYVQLFMKATRQEIGDSETAWEVKETIHITPQNSNGWQSRTAFVDIASGNSISGIDSADERLVEFMPKVTVNGNSNSYSISSTLVKNYVNVGVSSSHSYSYSDIECKPTYKPNGQNYCGWEFAYEKNKSAAKYTSTHYPILHMRNRQSTFRFLNVNQIVFTKNTFPFIWSDQARSTGQRNYSYSDIRTGKK